MTLPKPPNRPVWPKTRKICHFERALGVHRLPSSKWPGSAAPSPVRAGSKPGPYARRPVGPAATRPSARNGRITPQTAAAEPPIPPMAPRKWNFASRRSQKNHPNGMVIPQPRVARHELPWDRGQEFQEPGKDSIPALSPETCVAWFPPRGGSAATRSGLAWISEPGPRVARYAVNPGLKETIPSGLESSACLLRAEKAAAQLEPTEEDSWLAASHAG